MLNGGSGAHDPLTWGKHHPCDSWYLLVVSSFPLGAGKVHLIDGTATTGGSKSRSMLVGRTPDVAIPSMRTAWVVQAVLFEATQVVLSTQSIVVLQGRPTEPSS